MRRPQRRRAGLAVALALALVATRSEASEHEEVEDLTAMSLEDLMDLEVTTASKQATSLARTPAAVHVITQEDIRRSGVTSVPEALRLAPGVTVAQVDASRWAISARGFTNEFGNKLLVMVDGRSVYSPSFSGVYWNEQDLMLENIDRIEVVRGPGGTVWGANAVNGVINIITKSAKDTQGLLTAVRAGDYETFTGAARWGGAVGEDVHYRVYGKFSDRADFPSSVGAGEAHDSWWDVQAGARMDWEAGEDGLFTLQGDFFQVDADRLLTVGARDEAEKIGGNVLTRYSHRFSETANASVQAYYFHVDRESMINDEIRDTFDIELQHSFQPFARNQLIWGGGYRITADQETNTNVTSFQDTRKTDQLYSIFLQDEITVVEDLLWLTLGSKFEHNDYTDWEIQPSGRVLLMPHERHSLWAAVSRAVRTPSRIEHDFDITIPVAPGVFQNLTANDGFDSEDVLAYEAGYRANPIDPVTFDIAGYYNVYSDLRSVETTPLGPGLLSSTFDNQLRGDGYGVEVSANWSVTEWLRLTGMYTYSRTDLTLRRGSTDTDSVASGENQTPRNQFRIASHLDLPCDLGFDAALGWVERLPGQGVDSYTRLDLRLAWQPIENLELALVGLNLIEEHEEFPSPFPTQASDIPRSFYGSVRYLFQ